MLFVDVFGGAEQFVQIVLACSVALVFHTVLQ